MTVTFDIFKMYFKMRITISASINKKYVNVTQSSLLVEIFLVIFVGIFVLNFKILNTSGLN